MCTAETTAFQFRSSPLPLEAKLTEDASSLSRLGPPPRVWRLPGHALEKGPFAPYLLSGKPAYFIPVLRGDNESIAVCRADGTVETRWTHRSMGLRHVGGGQLEVLPDGTLIYQYANNWNVIDADGNFLPLIRSKRLFERWPRNPGAPPHTPTFVHRAGGRAWIVYEGERLVEMDEHNGMPIDSWMLPIRLDRARSQEMRMLENGLILEDASGSPYFIGWDGATRRLTAG